MRSVALAVLAVFVCLPLASQTCPTPTISASPVTLATVPYAVVWSAEATAVELEESTDAAFTNPTRFTINDDDLKRIDARPAIASDTRFYYRVRRVCGSATSAFSATASTIVMVPPAATSRRFDITVPASASQPPIKQDLLVPGFGETATNEDRFAITTQASWLTVFPTNGALSAGGTTVQLTIDPSDLRLGTSSTTITITRNGGVVADVRIPLSITQSNPVETTGRPQGSPFGTLFIPAVAHAAGFNSQFRSDVRILNNSEDTLLTYDLTFTPAGTDGTTTGKKTSVIVAPNDVVAFDDIVLTAFGSGVLGEPGAGTLEIRPQRTGFLGTLFASSRTFNVNDIGTFGQFVPALDLNDFTGRGLNISLQQIVSNLKYRTNLGFVEGIGEPVDFLVKLFDKNGALLRTAAQSLRPYEFRQLNFGAPNLFPDLVIDDARVEIEVTSQTGLVTAYASILDNDTADPFLVFPVLPQTLEPKPSYIVAGIAELNSANNFHSDMRIYNPTSAAQTVTLSYLPQTGDPTPVPAAVDVSVGAGAISVINDVLPTVWALNGTGGAVSVRSAQPLVVTARTFSRNSAGTTYGLFIPAVTEDEESSSGVGDNDLNILQLEQSDAFRTNLGLTETTGLGPVSVLIEGRFGDEQAFKAVTLGPGEFRQIGRVFTDMGVTKDVYNGRLRIEPIAGTGKVSAYGAVVDNRTDDPTYVPALKP
jgi:hypothetical protein